MTVAETGALNGAARQMEILPSAVSKNITALENKLGAQLLNRTTHVRLLCPKWAPPNCKVVS